MALPFRTLRHLDALHTDQPAPAKFQVNKRDLGVSDMVCPSTFFRIDMDRPKCQGEREEENRKSDPFFQGVIYPRCWLRSNGTYRVVGSRVLVFGLDGNGLEHGDGRVDIQFQASCNLCHLVLDFFRLFFA